jgi:hypothetical protein
MVFKVFQRKTLTDSTPFVEVEVLKVGIFMNLSSYLRP